MKQFLIQSVKRILNVCGFEIHKSGKGIRRTTMAGILEHTSRLGLNTTF